MRAEIAEIAVAQPTPFWRRFAVIALRAVRPAFRLDGTQSAAWDVVVSLLEDDS